MNKQDALAKTHAALTAAYEKPTARRLEALYAPGAVVRCSHPVNDLKGAAAIGTGLLKPLAQALSGFERRDDIFFADSRPRAARMICATGHLCGTFSKPLFGIPPTGAAAWLRFGEFHQLDASGRIKRTWLLLDLLHLMHQAGIRMLPPSLGEDILVPGPATADGVSYEPGDPAEAEASIAAIEAMLDGLLKFKGDVATLKSMRQERYWHPQFMWYGPSGIGTSRALKGFQDFHQRPFLTALPDRYAGTHYARIGCGNYSATGGWPSLHATHSGPGLLGLPASGRKVTMRVMDFWRREGKLLRENWVLIDLPEFMLQIGRDVFAELPLRAAQRG